jgi:hypothetical protein
MWWCPHNYVLIVWGTVYCFHFCSFKKYFLIFRYKSVWLIDLQWVRALTVPMQLVLTDKPFVPHDLISAQYSPVPLPQFQMAHRLKILMSSGSKMWTQIYYPFLSKSPGKQIPSMFPNRAPTQRDTCLQGILTYLLIYLSISKTLRKQCPSTYLKAGPYGNRCPFQSLTEHIFWGPQ